MSSTMTLAEFKRILAPGQHISRVFFSGENMTSSPERRVISSVTSGGFCHRDEQLRSVSEMRFGKASEWEFDDYIDGFSAFWTDPEDSTYSVQYILMGV